MQSEVVLRQVRAAGLAPGQLGGGRVGRGGKRIRKGLGVVREAAVSRGAIVQGHTVGTIHVRDREIRVGSGIGRITAALVTLGRAVSGAGSASAALTTLGRAVGGDVSTIAARATDAQGSRRGGAAAPRLISGIIPSVASRGSGLARGQGHRHQ
jgi:hypothetical protein